MADRPRMDVGTLMYPEHQLKPEDFLNFVELENWQARRSSSVLRILPGALDRAFGHGLCEEPKGQFDGAGKTGDRELHQPDRKVV